MLLLAACNNFRFTPRSRTNKLEHRPSIFIYSGIVDFREEFGCWPSSKEDMLSKGKKYADAFNGFKYNYTQFRIIDSNTMVFYFYGHIKDELTRQETGESELNSYHGRVRFYKHDGKFIWKLKMK
jgi:hypothetical protein